MCVIVEIELPNTVSVAITVDRAFRLHCSRCERDSNDTIFQLPSETRQGGHSAIHCPDPDLSPVRGLGSGSNDSEPWMGGKGAKMTRRLLTEFAILKVTKSTLF